MGPGLKTLEANSERFAFASEVGPSRRPLPGLNRSTTSGGRRRDRTTPESPSPRTIFMANNLRDETNDLSYNFAIHDPAAPAAQNSLTPR